HPGRVGCRLRPRLGGADPVRPRSPHRGQEARPQRFHRALAYPTFSRRDRRSVTEPPAVSPTAPSRTDRDNESKESKGMRIVQRIAGYPPTTRVRRFGRTTVSIAMVSTLSLLAVSAAAGADPSPASTTSTTASTTSAPSTTATTGTQTTGTLTPTTKQPNSTTPTTQKAAGGAQRTSLLERPNATPQQISGTGPSFASPAIESWISTTNQAPYNLNHLLNWAASNSGQGRFE